MSALSLRATSARAPYRRGGLTFEFEAGRAIASVTKPVGYFTATAIAELVADPFIDVLVGTEDGHPEWNPGGAWTPLTSAEHAGRLLNGVSSFTDALAQSAAAEPEVAAPFATFAPAPAAPLVTDDIAGQRLVLEGSRPDDDTDTAPGLTAGNHAGEQLAGVEAFATSVAPRPKPHKGKAPTLKSGA